MQHYNRPGFLLLVHTKHRKQQRPFSILDHRDQQFLRDFVVDHQWCKETTILSCCAINTTQRMDYGRRVNNGALSLKYCKSRQSYNCQDDAEIYQHRRYYKRKAFTVIIDTYDLERYTLIGIL